MHLKKYQVVLKAVKVYYSLADTNMNYESSLTRNVCRQPFLWPFKNKYQKKLSFGNRKQK